MWCLSADATSAMARGVCRCRISFSLVAISAIAVVQSISRRCVGTAAQRVPHAVAVLERMGDAEGLVADVALVMGFGLVGPARPRCGRPRRRRAARSCGCRGTHTVGRFVRSVRYLPFSIR